MTSLNSQPVKRPEPHYIKIFYEDENRLSQSIIIQIPEEDYLGNLSYLENVEKAACDIMEDGGFWLNSSTITPYHMIRSIKTHLPLPKSLRKVRRPKIQRNNDNTVSGTDKVPPNSSSSGKNN